MLPVRSLAVVVAVLAAGCAGAPEAVPTPNPSEERIAAVRAARETVSQPAVEVGAAARQVVAAVEALRTDPPADPEARLERADTVPDDALAELDRAIRAAREVTLQGDTEDVEAARTAFAAVVEHAEDVAAAAREDVAAQAALARTDLALRALTERWDARGSRREQLEAFAELAADAEALAEDLAAFEPVAACMGAPERRLAAARAVAEATRELRGHVEGYRGNAFDERRDELTQDPYGLGRPLAADDAGDLVCWQQEAPVVEAAAEVDAALERLEAALNPADLQG